MAIASLVEDPHGSSNSGPLLCISQHSGVDVLINVPILQQRVSGTISNSSRSFTSPLPWPLTVMPETTLLSRLRLLRPPSLPARPHPRHPRQCRRCLSLTTATATPQKIPVGDYYESILRGAREARVPRPFDAPLVVDVPLSDPRAAVSFDTSPPAPPPLQRAAGGAAGGASETRSDREEAAGATADTEAAARTTATTEAAAAGLKTTAIPEARATEDDRGDGPGDATPEERIRMVFGSRLLGPAEQAERAVAKRDQSTLIAGVLVPPRPEEPDNCCMSGCVNCVWDRYGEDLEEWAARKSEAENLLGGMGGGVPFVDEGGAGGDKEPGKEGKVTTKEMLEEEAYSDVPMGILEFMKMEKRLRAKHKQEKAIRG